MDQAEPDVVILKSDKKSLRCCLKWSFSGRGCCQAMWQAKKESIVYPQEVRFIFDYWTEPIL